MDAAALRESLLRVMKDETCHGKRSEPTWVTAYQVFARLPGAMRAQLIADEGGVGGRAGDAGQGTGAINAVMRALKQLADDEGRVVIDYFDAYHDTWFNVGEEMMLQPGNVTCAIYKWVSHE